MRQIRSVWREALTGELCWVDSAGSPNGIAVTPLLRGEAPCVALPYSCSATIDLLETAHEIGFAVTDRRSLREGRDGLTAFGPVRVTHDLSGSVFGGEMLEQELRKYPPSRALADSLLLRRENWWWMPRVIVELSAVNRLVESAPRSDPARHALLVHGSERTEMSTVEVGDRTNDRTKLTPLDDVSLPDGVRGTVFGYDYTSADLERWESWRFSGRVSAGELEVSESEGEPGERLRPLGLLRRIRRRHGTAKACRAGIIAAERCVDARS
ncbi:hypothetical protein SAMN04487905_113116 [Actinopolyspora xinjiangensis]|uniref:Uncharacterized protein n=1 Tax=Actinopolyspora xinjiangensis TaxID=405564 RepID=A0A1H0WP26_9ACTN|nr:hypothetical protein [Actinopolyspora xinjiangensis]SDP92409.1 hypothetical protein SAMN04487905_113116 [Actinopolyspora xinjiangensis]